MNPIKDVLTQYPVMILDGALATELERRGCDLRDPLWSAKVLIETPDLIREVHREYFQAGADCATTASYQATFEGFAARGIDRTEAADLLLRAVQLAIEAREQFWSNPTHRIGRPRPLVAASIGSYGAYLADGSEYTGDYNLTEGELMDFHRPRLGVLASSGADLLACETIPSLAEARALARLMLEFPAVNGWISFSARDAERTSHGELVADCSAELDAYEQVVAVGINCTPPHLMEDLIAALGTGTTKPIVVYPNSGELYSARNGGWSGAGEIESFAEQARRWYEQGARVIGGCCRTGPEQIRELAEWARGAAA